ncbi:MAG: DUF4190 domain-containing protein, partial [bacterium]
NFCPNCGSQLEPGTTVCPQCNQALTGGTGQTPPSGPDQQYGPPGAPGQPPYGVQYGAPPPVYQGPRTSGLAIASLVLGILAICYGFTGIVGFILGLVAISQINNSEGQLGGKGLAIAGTITSGVFLAGYALLLILLIVVEAANI